MKIEDKLISEFSEMFPGYRLEPTPGESFKLLRINAIETEDTKEDVWIATVYEMAELFMLFEYNRHVVNERTEDNPKGEK